MWIINLFQDITHSFFPEIINIHKTFQIVLQSGNNRKTFSIALNMAAFEIVIHISLIRQIRSIKRTENNKISY